MIKFFHPADFRTQDYFFLAQICMDHRTKVDKHTLARLSFSTRFQRWNNLDSSRWIDVILLTSFQSCFANVETTSINVHQLNFHFQSSISIDVFAEVLGPFPRTKIAPNPNSNPKYLCIISDKWIYRSCGTREETQTFCWIIFSSRNQTIRSGQWLNKI